MYNDAERAFDEQATYNTFFLSPFFLALVYFLSTVEHSAQLHLPIIVVKIRRRRDWRHVVSINLIVLTIKPRVAFILANTMQWIDGSIRYMIHYTVQTVSVQ